MDVLAPGPWLSLVCFSTAGLSIFFRGRLTRLVVLDCPNSGMAHRRPTHLLGQQERAPMPIGRVHCTQARRAIRIAMTVEVFPPYLPSHLRVARAPPNLVARRVVGGSHTSQNGINTYVVGTRSGRSLGAPRSPGHALDTCVTSLSDAPHASLRRHPSLPSLARCPRALCAVLTSPGWSRRLRLTARGRSGPEVGPRSESRLPLPAALSGLARTRESRVQTRPRCPIPSI